MKFFSVYYFTNQRQVSSASNYAEVDGRFWTCMGNGVLGILKHDILAVLATYMCWFSFYFIVSTLFVW